jgi:hypothetical protein
MKKIAPPATTAPTTAPVRKSFRISKDTAPNKIPPKAATNATTPVNIQMLKIRFCRGTSRTPMPCNKP